MLGRSLNGKARDGFPYNHFFIVEAESDARPFGCRVAVAGRVVDVILCAVFDIDLPPVSILRLLGADVDNDCDGVCGECVAPARHPHYVLRLVLIQNDRAGIDVINAPIGARPVVLRLSDPAFPEEINSAGKGPGASPRPAA